MIFFINNNNKFKNSIMMRNLFKFNLNGDKYLIKLNKKKN